MRVFSRNVGDREISQGNDKLGIEPDAASWHEEVTDNETFKALVLSSRKRTFFTEQ
jgi:hypothetical protein